jgi:hypothetical protein
MFALVACVIEKGALVQMNARIDKPEWQRFETWLIWVAVLAAALLVLAPRAANPDRFSSPKVTECVRPRPIITCAETGFRLPRWMWCSTFPRCSKCRRKAERRE